MRRRRVNFITILLFTVTIGLAFVLLYYGPLCGPDGRDIEFFESEIALRDKEIHEFRADSPNSGRKNANDIDCRSSEKNAISLQPWIYAVTPTYTRTEQKAELVRLSQTLMHLTNFHWIVIEDSSSKTRLVTDLLKKSCLSYTHLNVSTPSQFKLRPQDHHWSKPRGVAQRNAGLKWLRQNWYQLHRPAVLYFMDDDNTYDLELFTEMRLTRSVSVWLVGLAGKLRYGGPICDRGKVTGWFTFWKPERSFPIDMAGFAVNLDLILRHSFVEFSQQSPQGYQESHFLSQLITFDELEPSGKNCSQVLVWHTRTEIPDLSNEVKMRKKFNYGSNVNIEV